MGVIVKSGQEIETLNMSETMIEEDVVGTVGTIYKMKGGGMIYVPSKYVSGTASPSFKIS